MSRITLLDGHYGKQTGILRGHQTPTMSGTPAGSNSSQIMAVRQKLYRGRFRWRPARWGTCHDRIIAKINSVHAYDRLFSHRAGIMPVHSPSGPSAFPIEETFSLDISFCVGRNRSRSAPNEPRRGALPEDPLQSRIPKAVRNLKGRGHEKSADTWPMATATGNGWFERALFHLNPSIRPGDI